MEDFGDIEETDDIAIFVTNRLKDPDFSFCNTSRYKRRTYKMSEMLLHHELKGLRGACRVPSDHWVLGHDLTDKSSSRIKSFGCDLSQRVSNPPT